ncbi:MAG: EFR1 family ferrodoxin [Clostridiales bacterium]|jgi:ferredoxin|nr:EFR1 family ferrodoxin [Clostridiales bacterium]
MKAVIFYFSGTGNTWYVSKKLAFYLNQVDIETKFYSIETIDSRQANQLVEENDIVLFGYPVYATYIPEPMLNFVDSLDNVVMKTAGVFCTRYLFSGDCAKLLCALLNEKGFIPKWSVHFKLPNNLNCGPFSFAPITNDPEILHNKLRKTFGPIKHLAKCIYKDKVYLQDFNGFIKNISKVTRPNNDLNKYRVKWGGIFSINAEKCSSCGQCARQCPTQNIKKVNFNYSIEDNCVACQRCYNFCPNAAIMYKNKETKKEAYKGPVPNFNPLEMKRKTL